MDRRPFQALQITEINGQFKRSMRSFDIKDLPDGDVLIKVVFSSLNYKDALSANGNRGVTRQYPHVPGVDAAGIVIESRVGAFKPGDKVIATGFDLGMNTHGGFQRIYSRTCKLVHSLTARIVAVRINDAGYSWISCRYECLSFD